MFDLVGLPRSVHDTEIFDSATKVQSIRTTEISFYAGRKLPVPPPPKKRCPECDHLHANAKKGRCGKKLENGSECDGQIELIGSRHKRAYSAVAERLPNQEMEYSAFNRQLKKAANTVRHLSPNQIVFGCMGCSLISWA